MLASVAAAVALVVAWLWPPAAVAIVWPLLLFLPGWAAARHPPAADRQRRPDRPGGRHQRRRLDAPRERPEPPARGLRSRDRLRRRRAARGVRRRRHPVASAPRRRRSAGPRGRRCVVACLGMLVVGFALGLGMWRTTPDRHLVGRDELERSRRPPLDRRDPELRGQLPARGALLRGRAARLPLVRRLRRRDPRPRGRPVQRPGHGRAVHRPRRGAGAARLQPGSAARARQRAPGASGRWRRRSRLRRRDGIQPARPATC